MIDIHDANLQQRIEAADLVFALDFNDSDHEVLVYGRELCELVIAGNQRVTGLVVRVRIDFDTDDLEKLCAMVEVIKGSHCYQWAE